MPPAAACRFSTASSYTPALQPSPRAHSDEASSGVQLRSPIGLLLTCGPRMERAPLGLNPELRTPPLPATHVRAETSLNTSSGLRHRCRPPSTSPLNTSDFVSHHLSDAPLALVGSNSRKSNPPLPQGHSHVTTRPTSPPTGGSGLSDRGARTRASVSEGGPEDPAELCQRAWLSDSRYSPVVPSMSSRTTSRWPTCRANS